MVHLGPLSSPRVMKRIALAGGPGSGKTSAARQLVTELYNKAEPKRNAQQVTEFARDYINACRTHQEGQFRPTLADQMMIYREQLSREEILNPDHVEFLVTDSPTFLTFVFGLPMIAPRDYQQRQCFLRLYDEWLATGGHARYDHVFLLKREKPFFQDGTRGEDAERAKKIDARIRGFLTYHEIDFIDIEGTDEERIKKILEVIT